MFGVSLVQLLTDGRFLLRQQGPLVSYVRLVH
jgi:hypothetical protein